MSHLDYGRLSRNYDQRYVVHSLSGVDRALESLIDRVRPKVRLEVGCGTGRWLPVLATGGGRPIGADLFPAMLAAAARKVERPRLVCADGDRLPFTSSAFDLVVSINALHHLRDPEAFIRRCADCLRPGGALGLVHYDPGRKGQSWYVYDAFEGTLDSDLERFPSVEQILGWVRATGLHTAEPEVVDTIERHYLGQAVLEDYFLEKDSNSTLARLDDRAYERALKTLRQRIDRARIAGKDLRFNVRLQLLLLVGRKP